MNRRAFLRFLGLIPMGVAAAAAMPTVRHHGGLVQSKAYVPGERVCETVIASERYQELLKRGLMSVNEVRRIESITLTL